MLLGNLKARPGKIIARIIEKDEKVLESGIILTGKSVDQAMEDMRRAEIITSGVDGLNAGDIIVYLKFVGTEIGNDYIILTDDDVLATEE